MLQRYGAASSAEAKQNLTEASRVFMMDSWVCFGVCQSRARLMNCSGTRRSNTKPWTVSTVSANTDRSRSSRLSSKTPSKIRYVAFRFVSTSPIDG